jgi:protein-glucosylgalactosylhydroxylysine glucosidase
LDFIQDRSQIEKDLAYYEGRMSPEGPAMGFSVLATLHARLGNTQKAFEIFQQSYRRNEVPPFGVLAETAGGTNPYFATGAGGMLQSVIFGFGGLRVSNDGISQVKPALPTPWKILQIKGVGIERKTFTADK